MSLIGQPVDARAAQGVATVECLWSVHHVHAHTTLERICKIAHVVYILLPNILMLSVAVTWVSFTCSGGVGRWGTSVHLRITRSACSTVIGTAHKTCFMSACML